MIFVTSTNELGGFICIVSVIPARDLKIGIIFCSSSFYVTFGIALL